MRPAAQTWRSGLVVSREWARNLLFGPAAPPRTAVNPQATATQCIHAPIIFAVKTDFYRAYGLLGPLCISILIPAYALLFAKSRFSLGFVGIVWLWIWSFGVHGVVI